MRSRGPEGREAALEREAPYQAAEHHFGLLAVAVAPPVAPGEVPGVTCTPAARSSNGRTLCQSTAAPGRWKCHFQGAAQQGEGEVAGAP